MAELRWSGKRQIDLSALLQTQHDQSVWQTLACYPPEQATDGSSSWQHRLIKGNNQLVLPALLPEFAASINLIYIDPPFMTGHTFHNGTQLAYRDTWHNNLDAYLQWLYEILTLLHALLAPNGCLYLHLDWRVTHYARVMLDEIFGSHPQGSGVGFKNEIIWHYQSGGHSRRYYARKHDTILFYTKASQYSFHPERIGARRGTQRRNHMRRELDTDGRVVWSIRSAGRTYTYNEDSLISPSDVWSDIHHLHQKDPERSGYATQKPAALLERILLASSEEHDLVLDCFCGSGVTPVVAERLQRRWLAVDQSELAITTTCNRLLKETRYSPFVLQQLAPRPML